MVPLTTAVRASALGSVVQHGVRWASVHTGLPAFLLASVAVVAGYRILKSGARFAAELALVALLLAAATEAGWIRW